MGGMGSGIWHRFNRKTTVEDSLTLAVRDFRGKIRPKVSGAFVWRWASGNNASVGYRVSWDDGPIITLNYRYRDREDVAIPIRLQTTPAQFGGRRWWFTCPLAPGGAACDRRIGKLYLPPGGRYFGCRQCHDLTYRSCQEAHRVERQCVGLAREIGYDDEIGELLAARLSRNA